jgi:hypothetical protein
MNPSQGPEKNCLEGPLALALLLPRLLKLGYLHFGDLSIHVRLVAGVPRGVQCVVRGLHYSRFQIHSLSGLVEEQERHSQYLDSNNSNKAEICYIGASLFGMTGSLKVPVVHCLLISAC